MPVDPTLNLHAAARAFVDFYYGAGLQTTVLEMGLSDGRKVMLPVPPRPVPHSRRHADNAPPEEDLESEPEPYVPFIPTPFQTAILAALEGKSMRTDALGAAVGDRSRLYRTGGLKELRERGLVDHHERFGFFRPDAPPQSFS